MRLGRCAAAFLVSLSVLLSLLAMGCSSGTSQPTVPPSPRSSPTTLTERQTLVRYLAEFGKWDRIEVKTIKKQGPLFHEVHEHWWSLTTAQKHKAAQKALSIARQFDNLSVNYGALTPPRYLAKSQADYVKFLRRTYSGMLHYSTYLKNGGSSTSEWKASDKDFTAANEAFRRWAFAVRVAAKRLNVRIPFKIKAD